ncbi:Hpt domain-containing protein [Flammeovirga kamogawensis]|uniref:Hpt domain-containing protein n=1 Tax=Flammeovirga kamogawensis TaxID=373891 RepID=A0ABX8GRQ7_9BACT|nr:Hpt domain-containing protein [Flammeovirga kamogawensis]MBB6463729.1 HPt (histidine-containing phosphotransfer) domain-containing protein [Flammeovirga kamogawensis]QWG06226.1 Hpt domain-containing protein [Flammeovirga kamogawensis]TRX68058.1 Hpt domain-containing protein [Flammeovirga kamogawensis]
MKPNYFTTYTTIPLLKLKIWTEIQTFAINEYQLKGLVESFEQDLHDLINNARLGLKNDNQQGIFEAMHTLKGIAGTLGATRLHKMAQSAEKLSIKRLQEKKIIDQIEQCGNASLKAMNSSSE